MLTTFGDFVWLDVMDYDFKSNTAHLVFITMEVGDVLGQSVRYENPSQLNAWM